MEEDRVVPKGTALPTMDAGGDTFSEKPPSLSNAKL
jgi:hypothetical protein